MPSNDIYNNPENGNAGFTMTGGEAPEDVTSTLIDVTFDPANGEAPHRAVHRHRDPSRTPGQGGLHFPWLVQRRDGVGLLHRRYADHHPDGALAAGDLCCRARQHLCRPHRGDGQRRGDGSTFSPDGACDRAQIVTMLSRLLG